MALADKLHESPTKGRTGLPCSVGELLTKLPESESKALTQMLTTGWSQDAIYRALTDEGHVVGRQTINRHRSQACRCFQ